jgi:hypothetical protein
VSDASKCDSWSIPARPPRNPRQPLPIDNSDDAEAEIDDDDIDNDPDSQWAKVSSPLPQAAQLEAQQFGAWVNAEAAQIARKYRKSVRQII